MSFSILFYFVVAVFYIFLTLLWLFSIFFTLLLLFFIVLHYIVAVFFFAHEFYLSTTDSNLMAFWCDDVLWQEMAEMYVGDDVSPDFYGWVFPKYDHVGVGTGTVLNRPAIKDYQVILSSFVSFSLVYLFIFCLVREFYTVSNIISFVSFSFVYLVSIFFCLVREFYTVSNIIYGFVSDSITKIHS